ncbi:MAG: 16S rRNA (uracil(1498)-N(3))-methyltransferase [Halothiobacillaceae bacterium]
MRVPRLYLDADLTEGATLDLPPDRFNYLRNVLRLRPEAPVRVFDGRGREAAAVFLPDRRDGRLAVGAVEDRDRESPLNVHILQGISKGERMDLVVQKAVELGVKRITPVRMARSVVDLKGDRARRRHARWREIAINACEQCGRNHLPVIDPIADLPAALESVDSAAQRWVLHTAESDTGQVSDVRQACLAIGPEGGLTDEEVAQCEQAGFSALWLGPRILRTETAAIAALAIMQARFGDM